jgi:alginate O-acetyltransferase complex protein AlgI
MRFTSLHFFAFFAVVILGLLVIRRNETKLSWLLLAGAFFYGYFDWHFLALIGFTSLFDFWMGIRIGAAQGALRKRLLVIDITVNLGILFIFKYLNFFLDSAARVLEPMGMQVATLNILLPIGISFFVFEAMSYCIDIYRGDLKPYTNWKHFALFIFFFPRMIAGPIIRPADFLPQLQREIRITWPNFLLGGQQFLVGMTKKLVVADRLSPFVDNVFSAPHLYSGFTVWQATIAYSIQIFCDFSGYSDMALGSAKMLGFELPANFRMPYVSTSVTEFWRRWHISLSSWLRDYLYIPLGGNRKGVARTYINLFITMALGGLWHGASWHFLTWGVLHGLGLIVHKLWMEWRQKAGLLMKPNIVITALSWALTYAFVCLCWIFFRSQTFADALVALDRMLFHWGGGVVWFFEALPWIVAFSVAAHLLGQWLLRKRLEPVLNPARFPQLVFLCFWVLGIYFLSANTSAPFIYFQF